jgi:hypothetical protein
VRLLIAAEPAVTWEMGLSGEDDPRLLPDGHAYGFGTDGDGIWPVRLGRSAACEPVAVAVVTSWLRDLRPVRPPRAHQEGGRPVPRSGAGPLCPAPDREPVTQVP